MMGLDAISVCILHRKIQKIDLIDLEKKNR